MMIMMFAKGWTAFALKGKALDSISNSFLFSVVLSFPPLSFICETPLVQIMSEKKRRE